MTSIQQIIEQEAFIQAPVPTEHDIDVYDNGQIAHIKRRSFISGANFALGLDRWVKVDIKPAMLCGNTKWRTGSGTMGRYTALSFRQ